MRTIQVPGTSSVKWEEVECFQVTGEATLTYWEQFSHLVEKWVQATMGELTAEDVFTRLGEGLMQAFCIHTAGDIRLVVITEFVQYPQMKTLRIVGMAGEHASLGFKFFPAVEVWARENGATAIESLATPKMVKYEEHLGFKQTYTLMRKALTTAH